ncbi:nose resistant to fluoxetine protein 6-like isoform X1 [Photinus pyralis]|nr:nose resistant to fluoxetine protein 6-like isoform X1 [Photinus pyralis]
MRCQIGPDFGSAHLSRIFSGNLSAIDITGNCVRDLKVSATALEKREPWILKMLDASSKIRSGVLRANLFDLGALDECISINREIGSGRIHGKFCPGLYTKCSQVYAGETEIPANIAATMDNLLSFSEKFALAICIPHTCSAMDIEKLLTNVNATFKEEMCQTKDGQSPLGDGGTVVLLMFGGAISLVVISTAIDVAARHQGKAIRNSVICAFSAIRNGKIIFKMTNNPGDISCLNGIRVLSFLGIVSGHTYLYMIDNPTRNAFNIFEMLSGKFQSVISAATLNVDTFFLLSGAMVSYSAMNDFTKGYRFSVPVFYLRRILRLTPCLIAVGLIYIFLLRHMSHGPMWPLISGADITNCNENWWSTLFYVQNYANPLSMCIVPSWFLAVDMHLYILSPILIVPMAKSPRTSMVLAGLLTLASMGAGFAITWRGQLALASVPYMKYYYYSTHTRASPWFIGFMLGYAISPTGRWSKARLGRTSVILCWTACILTAVCELSWGYLETSENVNVFKNSIENCLRRPAWAVAVAWVIYSCHIGYGGIVNTVLSLPIFKVLSKLTYCGYLLHCIFIITANGNKQTELYASHHEAIYLFCGTWVLTQVAAVFLTFTVESPMLMVEKLYLRKVKSD